MLKEIKVYNNKIEVLESVHGHLYMPFIKYENDHMHITFVVWNKSWCELAVHVLSDPAWGLHDYEVMGVRFPSRYG